MPIRQPRAEQTECPGSCLSDMDFKPMAFRRLGDLCKNMVTTVCYGVVFLKLSALGPVSHLMQKKFPLHEQMLETLEEAIVRQDVKKYSLETVKTKSIYISRMED